MKIERLNNRIRKLVGKNYVEIGKYTYGAQHISLHFSSANLIIGKFCSIADNVHIFLGGNHNVKYLSTFPFGHTDESRHLSSPIENHPVGNGDIIIGNDVWIGSGASIMSGITIGDGAVIAARSHVVSSIPPYSIYGGNPAKLIRMRFSEEVIEELLEIQWWNHSDHEISKVIPLLTTHEIDIMTIRKVLSNSDTNRDKKNT